MKTMICGVPLPGMGVVCDLPPHGPGVDHRATVGEPGYPRRSTRVDAASARATFPQFERSNVFLFDPEQPHEDPNDLLNRVHGGKMMDPRAMNHNCPFCNRTMAWDLFVAHAEACFRRWRKVVYRTQRIVGTVVERPAPKIEVAHG